MNELANGESNNYYAATSKISDNLFKKRGPAYIKLFLLKLNALTKDDVVYAIEKYFKPMFDSELSLVFSSIPSEKEEEMEKYFTELGYRVHIEVIDAEPVEVEDDLEDLESGSSEETNSEDTSDEDQ